MKWFYKKKKKWPWVIAILMVFLLIIFNFITPFFLKRYLQSKLNHHLPHHEVTIGHLSVNMFQLSYSLDDFKLYRRMKSFSDPLLEIKEVKIRLNIIRMISQVNIQQAKFNFIHFEPSLGKNHANRNPNRGWWEAIHFINLGHMNNLILKETEIHYRDEKAAQEHLFVNHINIEADDLYLESKKENFHLTAKFMDKSIISAWGKVRVEKIFPEIDLKLRMEKYPLEKVNFFFKNYAHFEVQEGEVEAFSEIHIHHQHLDAYVKPFVSHLKGKEVKAEGDRFDEKLQKLLNLISSKFFKNSKTGYVGTIVPIHGDRNKIEIDYLESVKKVIENAVGDPIPKGFGQAK
jgi:hypothetical protein